MGEILSPSIDHGSRQNDRIFGVSQPCKRSMMATKMDQTLQG
jgi:hypothetical protein